jgi:hypothetical protein
MCRNDIEVCFHQADLIFIFQKNAPRGAKEVSAWKNIIAF